MENVTPCGVAPSAISPSFSRNTSLVLSSFEDDYFSLAKTALWLRLSTEERSLVLRYNPIDGQKLHLSPIVKPLGGSEADAWLINFMNQSDIPFSSL